MSRQPVDLLPLTPATLHVLLALTSGDLHGYAIMQDVLRQSEGKYKLWPGTLYDNLQKLVRQELVEELGARPNDEDSRRRYYRLTPFGTSVLATEVERLEGVVRDAKAQLAALKPAGSEAALSCISPQNGTLDTASGRSGWCHEGGRVPVLCGL